MHSERGMQGKADINNVAWERGEFPILCEGCFGDNPYVRMQKHTLGGTCKMCDRPYTLFKWKPGRGSNQRKTEICQTCSKIKNLCQTCILDLEFGLPSQLRDAVLAQGDSTLVVPESEANREYFAAQHTQMVAQGTDPWSSRETPNEKLLQVIRNVDKERDNPRIKLPTVKRDATQALSSEAASEARKHSRVEEDIATLPFELPLPPGVSSVAELARVAEGVKVDQFKVVAEVPATLSVVRKPPKPAGPPPPSAFIKKSDPVETK